MKKVKKLLPFIVLFAVITVMTFGKHAEAASYRISFTNLSNGTATSPSRNYNAGDIGFTLDSCSSSNGINQVFYVALYNNIGFEVGRVTCNSNHVGGGYTFRNQGSGSYHWKIINNNSTAITGVITVTHP